jgi:hypothetical protein
MGAGEPQDVTAEAHGYEGMRAMSFGLFYTKVVGQTDGESHHTTRE